MLGPFSIDTYLPAFPAVERALGVGPLEVQQTLTAYFLAFGFMMLFHGTLSDSYGRRPVILVGLVVFAAAGVGCAQADSIPALIGWRVLQGASGGVGMIVGRAIIRDAFPSTEAQKVMALITMVFAIAPAIAPMIGGYLHHAFGWRAVFWFLAALGVVLFVAAARFLPETHPVAARTPFRPGPLARGYLAAARHRGFLLIAMTLGFNFAGFFVYIMSAPAFGYGMLGLEETQLAVMFWPGVIGMIGGSYLSGRVAGRITPSRQIGIAYAVMLSGAVFNAAYHAVWPPALPWSLVHLGIYCFGLALAIPSLSIIALDQFPENRGLASSVIGFVQSTSNAVLAGLIAPFVSRHPVWLAATMATLVGAGLVCWTLFLRTRRGRR